MTFDFQPADDARSVGTVPYKSQGEINQQVVALFVLLVQTNRHFVVAPGKQNQRGKRLVSLACFFDFLEQFFNLVVFLGGKRCDQRTCFDGVMKQLALHSKSPLFVVGQWEKIKDGGPDADKGVGDLIFRVDVYQMFRQERLFDGFVHAIFDVGGAFQRFNSGFQLNVVCLQC